MKYSLSKIWNSLSDEDQTSYTFCALAVAFAIFISLYFSESFRDLIVASANVFFYYTVILFAIWIFRVIRKKIIKNKHFYIVWCLFLLLSVPYIPILFKCETTQIGDFYEAKEYTEYYYVLMSREPENKINRKVYTLPAEIERRYDESEERHCYHINYLYFPNGGYLSFDYDFAYEEPSCSTVQKDKETEITDYHGDVYYITLTTEKAPQNK